MGEEKSCLNCGALVECGAKDIGCLGTLEEWRVNYMDYIRSKWVPEEVKE